MALNAQQIARNLLQKTENKLPVDILAIAKTYNIDINEAQLEVNISGVLIVRDGRAIIGVNRLHHPNRKRFSIAHELGHYFLHSKNSTADVFVDAAPVFFRDENSSNGTEYQEIQANAFAAELLMPESLLKAELRNGPIDAFDDTALQHLANLFGVSIQALSIRLTRLGLITFE